MAEVLAVGPGGNVDGKEIKMNVKEGQKVIYSKYAGTEVKLEGERAAKRVAHWQSVVASACGQSGRARIPPVSAPQSLAAACAGLPADSLRLCLEQEPFRASECTVLGPAPCFVPKINYNYRHRLTLSCKLDKPLRQLLAHLLRQFAQDKDNRGVSAFVDVNGFE